MFLGFVDLHHVAGVGDCVLDLFGTVILRELRCGRSRLLVHPPRALLTRLNLLQVQIVAQCDHVDLGHVTRIDGLGCLRREFGGRLLGLIDDLYHLF